MIGLLTRKTMDKSVIQSMAKWPNVPDCYGWLHLNAQGQWMLGEHNPSVVEHEGLKGFINRNYLSPNTAAHPGCWALQNGPQRVWVNLSLAPLIVHIHNGVCTIHTQRLTSLNRLVLSSDGVMYCNTALGAAAIASSSMEEFTHGLIENAQGDLFWQPKPGSSPIAIETCEALLIERTLGFQRLPQYER